MKKIYIFIILFCSLKFISAQNIQFPQSFKLEDTYFIEPLLDPLPNNPQTAGFKGNPGLITDTLVLKRLQSDYAEIGMEAIYYQYYGNADKATSALHVVKYKTVEYRKQAMNKLKASENSTYLSLDNYMISINILDEKDIDEQFDQIIDHYRQKLGATVDLARAKDIEMTAQQTQTTEYQPKNRTDYQKLSEKDIQRFFKMETKTHRLGSVNFYTYSNDNKTIKDTSYDAEEGKLVFNNEYVYKYDDNDSLIYESQYSEIPSADYPQFMEDKYTYHDDYSVRTRSFDEKVQDSVFTYYFRNDKNLIDTKSNLQKAVQVISNTILTAFIQNIHTMIPDN